MRKRQDEEFKKVSHLKKIVVNVYQETAERGFKEWLRESLIKQQNADAKKQEQLNKKKQEERDKINDNLRHKVMVNIELKKWAQNKDAILRKEKAEKKRKKELEEKQAKAKRFRRKKEENIL